MGEVVKFKKPRPSERYKGRTLCRSGFHKWKPVAERPFDVRQGRLVTQYRCERCGATKTDAR
ncbi:hypothetical protein HUS23_01010 [Ectothiorhodospiraceae bacterium 2226]|nr:hypothetical protein HUS23_01010 [Ectothiorhodospiraceae bacterium 2226]